MATPHADDIAIFSFLYPEPIFAASTGTITGRIRAPNNTTPVTGVNVIARNVANPYDDAVSAISSDFATDYTPGAPFVGVYTLRGLTPGASYAVFVDTILEGGFSTPPRSPLPGPEELYNGAGESNDFVADVPSVFTPVVAVAGVPVTGIDIIFNRLPPGPIPLGDDTSFEIFTDFPVRFCGQTYESVWVNANGSLTFGAGSSAFVESAGAMLTGPPRIAGLFDDLNPAAGGVVSFDADEPFADRPLHRRAGVPGGRRQHLHDGAAPLAARRLVRLRAARRPVHARLRRAQRHRRRRRLQLRRQGDVELRAGDRLQPAASPVRDRPRASGGLRSVHDGRQRPRRGALRRVHAEAVPRPVRAEQLADGGAAREAAVQHRGALHGGGCGRRRLLPVHGQGRRHPRHRDRARHAARHDARALRSRPTTWSRWTTTAAPTASAGCRASWSGSSSTAPTRSASPRGPTSRSRAAATRPAATC